mgnify:CR=1 FL=1|jgi:hypothetical protein
MATMISEVYAAFRAANVPENKAREAAEALSAENLATKSDMVSLDKGLGDLRGQFDLLKWMVGFNLAFTMAILWKIFG